MTQDEARQVVSTLDSAFRALEQPPIDDCVSRAAAIRLAEQGQVQGFEWQLQKLVTLPPVTPARKKGKWIVEVWDNKEHYICSSCQHVTAYELCYHYCPYCGTEMEAEQ